MVDEQLGRDLPEAPPRSLDEGAPRLFERERQVRGSEDDGLHA